MKKWEEHYDDLLFDFIQFRSEHPNGNLSDSIKDFKKEKSMSKEKRYRLLKDLPFISAGKEYFKDTKREFLNGDTTSYIPDMVGMKHERFAIHSDYVENNPEWFEEIKEEQPFQWSNELWNEFRGVLHLIKGDTDHNITEMLTKLPKFKASKQQTNTIPPGEKLVQDAGLNLDLSAYNEVIKKYQKASDDFYNYHQKSQPKTERIEVTVFEDMNNDNKGKGMFRLEFSKIIPEDKFPLIKKAIESVLNDEPILKGYYSEEQLREAEEKAFNAAREMTGYRFDSYAGGGSMGTNPAVLPEIKQKYQTFNDYKKQNT